ncbi:pollen-specific leucine-rich repeat extensin-like protein 1 [Schistocerca piceifrons]|uniref:pollen-specific leucine-rich repeat extensin-like protein 1 n=1 Tax=Schistocerca piceifrons TaxID=274613 RepID=UPI001F5E5D83|nr:pollen-specific leucine-rich repeat extensin-like protein 1 [Schistocerca piceifrons]
MEVVQDPPAPTDRVDDERDVRPVNTDPVQSESVEATDASLPPPPLPVPTSAETVTPSAASKKQRRQRGKGKQVRDPNPAALANPPATESGSESEAMSQGSSRNSSPARTEKIRAHTAHLKQFLSAGKEQDIAAAKRKLEQGSEQLPQRPRKYSVPSQPAVTSRGGQAEAAQSSGDARPPPPPDSHSPWWQQQEDEGGQ